MYSARRRFQKTVQKEENTDEGVPPIRFESLKQSHLRPKATVVAGGDPRRVRRSGWYLRTRGALPRLWVVELVVGEHHVDGGLYSGGRRFGRWWISPRRAANAKSRLGSDVWVHERVADAVWEAEVSSTEWIVPEPDADWGGRSRGRIPPRGPPCG